MNAYEEDGMIYVDAVTYDNSDIYEVVFFIENALSPVSVRYMYMYMYTGTVLALLSRRQWLSWHVWKIVRR